MRPRYTFGISKNVAPDLRANAKLSYKNANPPASIDSSSIFTSNARDQQR